MAFFRYDKETGEVRGIPEDVVKKRLAGIYIDPDNEIREMKEKPGSRVETMAAVYQWQESTPRKEDIERHLAPPWVNTKNLDAETVAEFTFELYPISGMFESHADFTAFVLEKVQDFQELTKDLYSWEDYEPHPDEAERGVFDYVTVIQDTCRVIIEDMRVQGSMP